MKAVSETRTLVLEHVLEMDLHYHYERTIERVYGWLRVYPPVDLTLMYKISGTLINIVILENKKKLMNCEITDVWKDYFTSPEYNDTWTIHFRIEPSFDNMLPYYGDVK